VSEDDWADGEPLSNFEPWGEEFPSTEPDDPLAFADPDLVKLGLTLDFGPGDLACNQEGVLSPAQITRLENDLRLFYWPMSAAAAVFALIIVLTGIASGSLASLFPALLVLSLGVIPVLLYRWEQMRLPQRFVRRTIVRIGGLSLTLRRWGLSDDDTVKVEGGKAVFGPKYLYKVLRGNRNYIAYYAPVRTWKGYRLLSLEPSDEVVEKPKRKPKR
jgi:hypothetical protein